MKKKKMAAKNDWIKVFGAKEHNLKNINVAIPKGTLTIITGPSGSGKSSLALDILFAEGKRRYMESLSSYARQFLGIVKKPSFETIEGLCPAIAIEQKTVGNNPRSTVGTITEIYDYLRVLFARIGHVHCPHCDVRIASESPEYISSMILKTFKSKQLVISAPIVRNRKGEFVQELLSLFKQGFYQFYIDGSMYKFDQSSDIMSLKLKKTYKHNIDVLVDSFEIEESETSRLTEAIERSFAIAQGCCKVIDNDVEHFYSSHKVCLKCSYSMSELEPRLFSFNSPIGACRECAGLGIVHEWPWKQGDSQSWKEKYPDFFGDKYAKKSICKKCFGRRLCDDALAVIVAGKSIYELGELSVEQLLVFFKTMHLDASELEIASSLITEISNRLEFLNNVGLSYLSLNRTARTLSGGEGQRIRLATQIGSALSGVLYILDEPSIGLHQRDNDRLITTLKQLRDQGNTVVVVEHDSDTIAASDYVIDMGPQAGILGGDVVAVGSPEELKNNPNSLTGAYLAGKKRIAIPQYLRSPQGFMTLHHARKNNLKDITVAFPLGVLCGISGVSGSGKSTLIMEELVPAVKQACNSKKRSKSVVDGDLVGADAVEHLVVIDQSPIGRTPRSNPATYLGIFDAIRTLFSQLPESKMQGYLPGRFSFNVKSGRCFECSGEGSIKVTMHFLPDVTMVCKACKGTRYNKETLQITYKGKTISDVLQMTAHEALAFFSVHSHIAKRLELLCSVGLDYIQLGQSSISLSGGEAQRIKLVNELAKRGKNTLYILDEPTTGLHTNDIEKLLAVLNRLVDKGNSMIVIEHNIDVLKTVDYLIDLGHEGGERGGEIVAQGTPRQVAESKKSYTGHYLAKSKDILCRG